MGDHGTPYPVKGGGNLVCSGLSQLSPASTMTQPKRCSDTPSQYMVSNKKSCATWAWGIRNYCNKEASWRANNYCALSCFKAGLGYKGDYCCLLDDQATPWMERKSLKCAAWSKGLSR